MKGRRIKDGSSGIWQDHAITGLGDILSYAEVIPEWSQAATFHSGAGQRSDGSPDLEDQPRSGGSPQTGVDDRMQLG